MNRGRINLQKAEEIYLKKYPNEKLISVIVLDDYYVFRSCPRGQNKENAQLILKPLVAVNRIDGRLMTFNPLHMKIKNFADIAQKNTKYYQ